MQTKNALYTLLNAEMSTFPLEDWGWFLLLFPADEVIASYFMCEVCV